MSDSVERAVAGLQEEAEDESGHSSQMLYVVESIQIECRQTETTKLLLEPGMESLSLSLSVCVCHSIHVHTCNYRSFREAHLLCHTS